MYTYTIPELCLILLRIDYSGNLQIKKDQQKIQMVLESKKFEFENIDVAASEEAKQEMRRLSGKPKALPPQIFNGDTYCGVGRTCLTYRPLSIVLWFSHVTHHVIYLEVT